MGNLISWIDAKWKAVVLIAAGLMGLLFWSSRAQKKAVDRYKERMDEDAARRSIAASEAVGDAARLEPDDLAERMRDKGWYRD